MASLQSPTSVGHYFGLFKTLKMHLSDSEVCPGIHEGSDVTGIRKHVYETSWKGLEVARSSQELEKMEKAKSKNQILISHCGQNVCFKYEYSFWQHTFVQ